VHSGSLPRGGSPRRRRGRGERRGVSCCVPPLAAALGGAVVHAEPLTTQRILERRLWSVWEWEMDVGRFIEILGMRSLYHFTDVQNLPLIRVHGLLSRARRELLGVQPPRPGGNQWSEEADRRKGLGDFVSLCLHDQHPMEYRAKVDGRIGPTRFLEIAPQVLQLPGVMGCAGVANRADAVIRPVAQALDEIDVEVLFEMPRDFASTEFQARFNSAKKAEILVPDEVATGLIRNLY